MWQLQIVLMALFVVVGSATVSGAQVVVGTARVIDGDTLEINERRVRLLGIDAPEAAQELTLVTGGTDFLGRGAALMLRSLVRESAVRCELSSQRDDRGVDLAMCFSGTVDLGATMVARGMAMATVSYRSPYIAIEAEARNARRGFWRDKTEAPWAFRRRRTTQAKASVPGGCAFKAKRDEAGARTLFTPWSPWYEAVQVNEANGDRWFCSEAEAVADGWFAPHWLMRSIVSGVYNP
ncbi:MAG: thermonuclease family protein [Pseudomonadota bacterium]